MSGNEETIRQAYDAFNRRDFGALDEICDAEVSWRWGRHFFEPDVLGLEALRDFFRRWIETFPDVHVELEEAIGEGDVLLVLVRQRGAGGASGVPAEMDFAQIITFREGKIADLRNYTDRREAREAYETRAPDASARFTR